MRSIRASSVLVVLVALAGCGGKTSDPAPGGTIDTTPLRPGWHSYDVTITDGRVDWAGSTLPELPPTFDSKLTARLDVHVTAAGVADRAVYSDAYQEVTEYSRGADGTLSPAVDAPTVAFRTDSSAQLSIQVKTLSITGGAIEATGQAIYVVGDVGDIGNATFRFAALDDATTPTWKTQTLGNFADLPLPWESQSLVVSEPTDPHAPTGPLFTSNLHASVTPMFSTVKWLGDTEATDVAQVLGVSVVTDQWDSAGSWTIQTPKLADYAGHALAAATLSLPIAPVLTLESSKITGDLDPKLGHTWGPIALDPKCGDGTAPCWHLGSVTIDFCAHATVAGFALSLSGSARRVAVEVRAVAKPAFGGGEHGLGEFAYLQYATPGATAVTEAIAFGDGTVTAGTWDSGWQRIERLVPGAAGASSAGVAMSIGGKGGFGFVGGGCGGPVPPSFPVDVYVRLVEILP